MTDQSGHNLTKLKQDIVEGIQKISQQKQERQACNEEISAIRADLEAKGIPKKALDMAMQYMNMDPDKREGFDVAYDIVREAVGLPYDAQGDLFAQTDQAQDEDLTSKMDDGEDDGADVVPLNTGSDDGENTEDDAGDPETEEFNNDVDDHYAENQTG